MPRGINSEGLKRRGFSSAQIMAIKRGYKTLYQSDLQLSQARAQLADMAQTDVNLQLYVEFIDASTRGILR